MESTTHPRESDPPAAFVSYSWAGEEHGAWVADLARRLRANGVDVHLDRWDVGLGHDLNQFMERYAEPTARVLVVLSDDYKQKADDRGKSPSGVGTETTIVSSTVYADLGGNRVVPVVPDSGTVAGNPLVPTYLSGRKWIDFRGDNEKAYEELLRELHGVPLEAAPPLGPNPFLGRTQSQVTAAIRNDPARWQDGRSSGLIEINLNQNSGRFTLGSGEASFPMHLDWPSGARAQPGGSRRVRHYGDYIGKIGLIAAASSHAEMFDDLALLPMSNRVESTDVGDVLVMLNHGGYWALLALDDVVFPVGPNGYEPVAVVRYVIATDRTSSLTFYDIPPIGVL